MSSLAFICLYYAVVSELHVKLHCLKTIFLNLSSLNHKFTRTIRHSTAILMKLIQRLETIYMLILRWPVES
jgi:hypothetical protein